MMERDDLKKLGEAAGIDIDKVSQKDVQDLLLNQINNGNINLDDKVKRMIKDKDIDGLRDELIKYLGNSGGGNDKLISMLKNNDMDGLKGQLLNMLFSNPSVQKKK